MYTKHFGFNEKPFTLTPNPRFIYLSKNHKEAFAHLLFGINNHYGFIELIGEVGTGKTTVLRTLLNQLQDEKYRTALIVNPCLNSVELLRSICQEFGLNSKSEYINELLIEINKFLLLESAEGRTVVLVIDEAQHLQPAVLEQIRLISNLETDNDKLIQIILAGQPELGVLLERPELRQLNQRIAVRYRLKSMSMFETRAYLRHRMSVAGETGGVSFSLFATRLIHLYTRGVPRMINILCDRSLLIGYGDERRHITAGVVTKAIRELLNITPSKRLSLTFAGLVSIIIILLALTVDLSEWRHGNTGIRNRTPSTTSNGTPVPAQKSNSELATVPANMVDQQFSRLQKEIMSYEQNDFHLHAFNAIADIWKARPITIFSGRLTIPDRISRFAAKRNLRITEYKGTLDSAARFDMPFLIKTKVSGSIDGYCIAVTSFKNNSVTVSPALFNTSTISKDDLNLISSGTFYLVWQNPGQIPEKVKLGDKRYEIRALQLLLQQAGKYTGVIDGCYTVATARAVTDFQSSAGISQDESVGELTLAALAKYYGNPKVPSISSPGSTK